MKAAPTESPKDLIKELIASRERASIFREIDPKKQGVTLLNLPRRYQKDIISALNDEEVVRALNHVSPDKATDLLQELPPKRADALASKLDESLREKVEYLLKFNPKAAAGLMTLDYVVVDQTSTFEQVAQEIKEHEQKTGKFPTILVRNETEVIGELPGHTLALHSPKEKIKNIQKVPSIKYDEDEHKVINLFLSHPHNKILVLDKDKEVIGIIASDDILSLIDKRSTHSLYGFAGVNKEEDVLDSAATKIKYRWKWLVINLATAFMAATVVSLFDETINKFVLLAVYMPIVAGMGGNAGTQALAVTVRGLVLKEVNWATSKGIILNEMVAGAVNGLINGAIVAMVAIFFNKSPMLGLVLGVAMVVNLIVAGFFGALVPMIMKSLGRDPASSATIFITTATDVFGFFVFLGLASILLV